MSSNTTTKKNNSRYTYQSKLTVQRYLESNIAKYNNPEVTYSDICRDVYNVVRVEMSEEAIRSLFKMACAGFGVKVQPRRPRKRKYKAQVVKMSTVPTNVSKITSLVEELMQQVQLLQGMEAKLDAAITSSATISLPVANNTATTTK